MKILVTGATGFVGCHIVRAVGRVGWTAVRALRSLPDCADDVEYRLIPSGDGLFSLLDGIDFVVHAAGVAHRKGRDREALEQEFQEGNAELTRRLAVAVGRSGAMGMIHVSSIAAAGHMRYASGPGLGEAQQVDPTGPYGRSKREAEGAVEALRKSGKLGVNLRPSLIYGTGARGNWPRLVGLARSPLPLPFASVKNRRSFLGIDNLCSLILRIIENRHGPEPSGTYHVADEQAVSLPEVVSSLRAAMGRGSGLFPFPPAFLAAVLNSAGLGTMSDGLFGDLILDTSRVRNAFGWRPAIATLDGMRACARSD